MTTKASDSCLLLRLRLRFLSLLFLYCVVFASSFLLINALGCRPDQIQTLLQFKNEFDSSGCNRSDYFNGVLCDNTTGAVTKLQLPSGCLTGILKPNSSLFELHHLRYLNLSHNNFTSSSLPSEFSNLNRLEVLSLSSNGFIGQVPSSFSNLSLLSSLDLSHNHFEGQILEPISKLITLKVLDLSFLNLSYPIDFRIFSSLKSLLNLELSGNILLPETPWLDSDIPPKLYRLMLKNCKIKDAFPFWLKSLPDLQVLTLRSNRLYGPISPPQGPLGFQKLHILDLSDNSFTGSLSSDYFVNWSSSSLKINGYMQMYMGDYKNTLYQYSYTLDLRYKSLYMEHKKVLTFYTAIDFSANRLGGQIPESIGLLTALIALNLSNNSFTSQIPQSFANLTELESLDLSRNKLSGKIPQELGRLSFLAYINVSNNQLNGEIPKGTQISGQPKSSFEGNAGLCDLPLHVTCFDNSEPPRQGQKQEDDKEEQVLNWKAVVIGYCTGVLFGLAIGHVIALYKQEWLIKIICLNKRRNH